MHRSPPAGDTQCLAQERGLLGIALDQMDGSIVLVGEGAGEDYSGKAAAASEIDPPPPDGASSRS